jgi:AraC-like DNA-binding protein
MLDFYKIVKENLSFNRFQYEDTVCLEYSCPIEAETVGIFSRNDYVVHVLSGKKTYKTVNGEWTLSKGQTLYLKKGAEIIHQYFDDEYCMLGFFLSDDLIKETYNEIKSSIPLDRSIDPIEPTAFEVNSTSFLEGYFHSMLTYFRGENRPPDHIMVLKLKELLITLMNSDPSLTSYFSSLTENDGPSLSQIMEKNFCFNMKLEEFADLTHRSLSSFKRDFQQAFNESPGKWLLKRRVQHAANLLSNTDMSVTQVAFESGFEDLSHFSRAFKNTLGISPTDHKKG